MESSLTLSTSAYIDGHAGSLVHNRYPDGESQVGCNTKHAVASYSVESAKGATAFTCKASTYSTY